MRVKESLKVCQGNITMYLFKLPVEELINSYEISYYDAGNKTGYQRPPQQSHYRKIAQFLVDSSEDNILPMSIITAVDAEFIKTEGKDLIIENKIRIVDGQHRIKGIEYLKNSNKDIYNETYCRLVQNYEFPIILLEVSERDSIEEIDTFININSKGKRVSINLAKELKLKKMKELLKNMPVTVDRESREAISTEITQKLAGDEETLWYNKIIMADENGITKPISIGAFSKSLDKIVGLFIEIFFQGKKQISYDEYNFITDEITELIKDIWDIIQARWPKCFTESFYNICKGIGVSSLHRLLASCIEEQIDKDARLNSEIIVKAKKGFKCYLENSTVTYGYWRIGGRFTGLSSEQGYDTIVKIIKNQADLDNIDGGSDDMFF